MSADHTGRPWMPPGTTLDLGRGRTLFVRDSGGSGPAVVLLHGWMATADLNFGFQYQALAERFRVISFDQRGHGRGLDAGWRFAFEDCADDVVAVLDALGIDRGTTVGYSMGGPVALTTARRHPDRIDGLVLCATSASFRRLPYHRALSTVLTPVFGLSGLLPDNPVRRSVRRRFISRRASGRHSDWIADQLTPSDLSAIAQAGLALQTFDADRWVSRLGVRSASVVTVDDPLVPAAAQRALAEALDRNTTVEVTGGHAACFEHPEVFTPALVRACGAVADRTGPTVRS